MTLKKFSFNVLQKDSNSRLGVIKTPRGDINTPAFMPVGTQGTVKSVFMEDVESTGAQIILSNTYHLMIRPGVLRIKKAGGLHQFMNSNLPILTDSGGFQIMSLSKLVKIDIKSGATFNSHIDGKKFILSPEESIKIQKDMPNLSLTFDTSDVSEQSYAAQDTFGFTVRFWSEKLSKCQIFTLSK